MQIISWLYLLYLYFMHNYQTHNFFRKILIAMLFMLINSCSWIRCKAEGQIIFREPASLSVDDSIPKERKIPLSEHIEYINSPEILNTLVQNLNQDRQIENYLSVKELAKDLNSEILRETDIVILKYKNSDGVFAEKVINTWINVIDVKYSKNIAENFGKLDNMTVMLPKNGMKILEYADGTCSQ